MDTTTTNCGWQIVHFTYEDVITIIFTTTESSRLKQRVGPKQISATCRNFVIGKMIQGLVSTRNLSGPITIAKIANQTAGNGLESFLGFIALPS